MKRVTLSLVLVAIIFGASSCDSKWTLLPKDESTAVKADVDTINIYLDVSKSMRGYIDGVSSNADSSQFNLKRVVSTIVTEAERLSSKQTCCYAVLDSKCNLVDTSIFPERIIDNSIFSGNETQFGEMLTSAINGTGKNGLSVVVTDGIMSYPPKQSNLNVIGIENLKVQVKRAAEQARIKGNSILIVKYNTDFKTSYYCNCDNAKPAFAANEPIMKKRPYYLIMIGNENAIYSLYSKMDTILKGNDGMYYRRAGKPDEIKFVTCQDENVVGLIKTDKSVLTIDNTAAIEQSSTKDIFYVGVKTTAASALFCNQFMGGTTMISENGLIDASTISMIRVDKMKPLSLEEDTVAAIYKMQLEQLGTILNSTKLTETIYLQPKQSIDKNSSIFPDNTNNSKDFESRTFAFSFVIEAIDEAYNKNAVGCFTFKFDKIN